MKSLVMRYEHRICKSLQGKQENKIIYQDHGVLNISRSVFSYFCHSRLKYLSDAFEKGVF